MLLIHKENVDKNLAQVRITLQYRRHLTPISTIEGFTEATLLLIRPVSTISLIWGGGFRGRAAQNSCRGAIFRHEKITPCEMTHTRPP